MRLLTACILFAGIAAAQTIDVSSGVPSTTLDGMWKMHEGDDLRWADPSLDDSRWTMSRCPPW